MNLASNPPESVLWELTFQIQALLQTEGFLTKVPPFSENAQPALADFLKEWSDRILPGTTWPAWDGPVSAPVLLIAPSLTSDEKQYARKWFENDKLRILFDQTFLVHFWPPLSDEDARLYFTQLIDQIKPQILFSLGPQPAAKLLQAPPSLDTLRSGEFPFANIPLLTTYHPSALLALPSESPALAPLKAQVWRDAQRLVAKLKTVVA